MMNRLFAIAAVAVLAQAASAQTTLYSNTFESGAIGPEWSTNTMRIHHSAFSWFVGRYSQNDSVTLKLDAPPPPTNCGGNSGNPGGGENPGCYNSFVLTFDLYIIDSWDGYLTPHGPDYFQVFINSEKVFEETFANQHEFQSFRAPDVGPVHLGYNPMYKDSIYRDIAIPFEIGEASMLNIKFRSDGLLNLEDESWGIDNVRVSYTPIPTPGSGALLAAGALVLTRRRRW